MGLGNIENREVLATVADEAAAKLSDLAYSLRNSVAVERRYATASAKTRDEVVAQELALIDIADVMNLVELVSRVHGENAPVKIDDDLDIADAASGAKVIERRHLRGVTVPR